MSNKKKLVLKKKNLFILCGIFLLLALFFTTVNLLDKSDGTKFKREYQALNGKKDESGIKYQKLKISKKNKIKYISLDELSDFMSKDSGIIFFGSRTNHTSRSVVNTLLDVMNKSCIDTLYYIDVSTIQDEFTVEEDNIKKVKDADEKYYNLLKILDDYLDDYIIKDDDGIEYRISEKRIDGPLVISLYEGAITAAHYGSTSLSNERDINDELSRQDISELEVAYGAVIDRLIEKGYCDNQNS